MLKRTAAITAILIAFCVTAMAQDLKDPKEIIAKAKDTLLGLKSYGFTVEKEGWDFEMEETAEATKSLTGEAAGSTLTKGLAKNVDQVDGSEPKWMTYTSDVMFMKPWVLRMKLVKNDYLPGMLQGGVMRYNYVKDKKHWSINTAAIKIGIPRKIDTESGNFLYSNWVVNNIYLNNLAKDVAPVLEGVVEVNGRKAYKIGFHFSDTAKPKTDTADLASWGVPKELFPNIEPETGWFVKNSKNLKDAYYYIDVKDFVLVQEEANQKDGKEYYKKQWKNIRLNDISQKEIMAK